MWNKRSVRTTLAAAGMCLLAACGGGAKEGGGALTLSSGTQFDPQVMENKIREVYQDKVVGFSYAINHNGQLARSGGGGWALRPADGGVAMSEHTRVQLASVSKTVNAIYFLHVMRRINQALGYEYLSLDQAVSPWLPDGWVQGKGFFGDDGVTFRELLTHTSGLRQAFDAMSEADQAMWGNGWDGLEFVVANGTMPGSPRKYKNANSALFRVLIPRLLRESGIASVVEPDRNNAGVIYIEYLNQYLFQPLGIPIVSCRFNRDGDYAKAYDLDGPEMAGFTFTWEDKDCGGHAGLYLSAFELAKLLAYVRYTDELLGDAEREEMAGDALGWFEFLDKGDIASARLRKRGDLYRYYEGKKENPNARADVHTCVIMYPRQVEAVLLVNSTLSSGTPSPCKALDEAYQAALVPIQKV